MTLLFIFPALLALICSVMAICAVRQGVPVAAGFWLVGAHIWTATLVNLVGMSK